MICTVGEAKKMWCPYVGVRTPPVANVLPAAEPDLAAAPSDDAINCIAQKCMAWWWTSKGSDLGYCGLTRRALTDAPA